MVSGGSGFKAIEVEESGISGQPGGMGVGGGGLREKDQVHFPVQDHDAGSGLVEPLEPSRCLAAYHIK